MVKMVGDRTVSAEPIRYTAATMEMMRLEDLQHVRCGVHYAADHSYGHLAPQIHKKYFAEKEWAKKDAIKTKELKKKFANEDTRRHISGLGVACAVVCV